MTDIQIDAGTLLFAAEDPLAATGLLVPYGVEAKSNLGRFTVAPGVFEVPTDVTGMGVNTEHIREKIVGAITKVWEQPEAGLLFAMRFADTPEGRAAAEDARKPGGRRHVSVEASNVIIKAGKAISGHIFGAAIVGTPAFAGATLLAAEDTEPPPAGGPVVTEEDITEEFTDENGVVHSRKVHIKTEIDGDKTTITRTEVIEEPQPNEQEEKEPTVLPNTLNAGAAGAAAPTPITIDDIGQMLYAKGQGTMTAEEIKDRLGAEVGGTLFGVLSDVKYDGVGGLAPTMSLIPQWIGEVWSSLQYRQQVLPLFSHKDLTSLTLNGFKWTTKPAGGDWPGNKGNVLSNTLVVAAVTGTAGRYAVGHDITREFEDFPVPGFFESYAAAVAEDYAKWADAKVSTAVIAGATALAGDALAGLPGVAGGTIGSAMSAIVDGATVLVTNGVLPDFALVAPALWKQMVKMPKSNVLGYLNAALGLAEGDLSGFILRPSASIAAGKVLVGAKEAATVYELPGAPIRIDALDLAKGGIDKAAFGYAGVVINDPLGLQLVTVGI